MVEMGEDVVAVEAEVCPVCRQLSASGDPRQPPRRDNEAGYHNDSSFGIISGKLTSLEPGRAPDNTTVR